MLKNQKISPKLMLTQKTFDTCIFQFPSLLPTESSVDKWHNQYMDIWRCTNTFVRLVYSYRLPYITIFEAFSLFPDQLRALFKLYHLCH